MFVTNVERTSGAEDILDHILKSAKKTKNLLKIFKFLTEDLDNAKYSMNNRIWCKEEPLKESKEMKIDP